ncbi:hypothetical protein [uncultured Tateyamaria sp.]|uniref:hypothetical protein n=1 Tax=uncultured Tateyamaria sp. TaxID=455651 RepID=UPI002618008B|nr:hypothetical protein [uncultured Tateyamaria sp.]
MRKVWLTSGIVCALGACNDPMSRIETVPQDAPLTPFDASAALPSEAELAREESVLAGLFRADEPVPKDDVTGETAVEADPVTPADADGQAVDLQTDINATVAVVVSPEPAPRQGRIVGWLRRAATAEAAVQSDSDEETAVAIAEPQIDDAPEQVVALELDQSASSTDANQPMRTLLGGGKNAPRSGPDARDVPLGTVLAFGDIARVCEAKPAQLGTLVDQGARKGRGYKLFDTVPDGARPRTFYVTGFADNCPRQFTASLALFGAPEFHEQLRYGLPAKEYPYSTTDQAYEKVKGKVCNVGRSKPCGARISRLDRTTVFVSAYENFGENARWADMLLHDGAILAKSLKRP